MIKFLNEMNFGVFMNSFKTGAVSLAEIKDYLDHEFKTELEEAEEKSWGGGFQEGYKQGKGAAEEKKERPPSALSIITKSVQEAIDRDGAEKPEFVKTEIFWDEYGYKTLSPEGKKAVRWGLADIKKGYRLVGFYFDDHMPTVAFPISVRTREKNGDPVSANKATHALWQKEE